MSEAKKSMRGSVRIRGPLSFKEMKRYTGSKTLHESIKEKEIHWPFHQ